MSGQSRPTGQSWLRSTALSMTLTLTLLVVLTGCTGGSDEAAPIPTIDLTTTTVPTTTTTEPAPTTTEDPNLAEIMAVLEGYFLYLPTNGVTGDNTLLGRFAADPILTRVADNLDLWFSAGVRVSDTTYDIRIVDVTINDTRATVTTCNLDGVSTETQTGEEFLPADTVRYLRLTELQLLDQGWRVTENGFAEGERTICEV